MLARRRVWGRGWLLGAGVATLDKPAYAVSSMGYTRSGHGPWCMPRYRATSSSPLVIVISWLPEEFEVPMFVVPAGVSGPG